MSAVLVPFQLGDQTPTEIEGLRLRSSQPLKIQTQLRQGEIDQRKYMLIACACVFFITKKGTLDIWLKDI